MGLGKTEARSCGPHCRACAALRRAAPAAVARRGIAAVTLEDFAEAAGMRGEDVRTHAHGDVTGLLGSAYLAHAGRLQACFREEFLQAPTPRHGLERSVRGLLRAVAEDRDRTLFCYVEIQRGAPALRALRSQIARGSVGLWAEVHKAAAAGTRGWLPPTHFEVVNSAVIHLIAEHAMRDRVDQLPARADAVLALVDPQAGRRHLSLA
jgi:AcrR family transcriptional regulator